MTQYLDPPRNAVLFQNYTSLYWKKKKKLSDPNYDMYFPILNISSLFCFLISVLGLAINSNFSSYKALRPTKFLRAEQKRIEAIKKSVSDLRRP